MLLVATLMPRPPRIGTGDARFADQPGQARRPEPDVGAGGPDLHPLGQRPHDARLLGGERLTL
jgi:hypothetical protein